MAQLKRLPVIFAALAALCAPAPAPALAASAPLSSALKRALLSSHELWATVNVCNPAAQRDTVGIRGSMPGDGQAQDNMYMSFRLQYRNTATAGRWVDLAGASTSLMQVGASATARQDGSSFTLVPAARSRFRGVVEFQWRRGTTVLLSVSRPTTAPHKSLAGADPAGFSSPMCLIR